jgi:OFA family oxalate/formate antiporter-like MFS transporter
MVAFGGITVAIGWMINAYATSLEMLYLGAIVSGAGGGAVYATCVGNAVKWFPDRRGLAVGLTAAGYGAGAALTVIPIRYVIDNYGYNAAFLWFGIVQGAVVFVLALLSAAQGRAVGAQLLTEGSAALPGVLAALPHVRDGIGLRSDGYGADRANRGRLQGGRSDRFLGRHHAYRGVDHRQYRQRYRATAIWMDIRQYRPRTDDGACLRTWWYFVLALGNTWNGTVGLCALTWGEIFSLFPSTCTDTFGPKFATVNLSLLYTAKGTSAFLVPIANVVKSSTGSWHMVFVVTALMNFLGGRACLVCAQTTAAADARRRLSFETAPPGSELSR